MKKLLSVFVIFLFLLSCSISAKTVKNSEFSNISLKNLNTEVKNGKTYTKIEYIYSELGSLRTSNKGIMTIVSDVKTENNIVYAKDAKIIDIIRDNGYVEEQKVSQVITNLVLNILTVKPLNDFNGKYYAENIQFTDSEIVVEEE
ncbi:hypothetical protein [Caviibacter abscessus]|uniref:hypothetical protein n=1 Tax=Caviibacter abscessus TaxID=1766719 RepID=UPI00083423F0|nr:hypothetical protein [Caviibacter abscessus]